jgi:GalNAc-alpha-(1->4)-GalNAc-alpha-(1->3)-diNAcBac-PP-undecaprenol alpha-1,4-N-acetyl-D-galactosaminyltransferase
MADININKSKLIICLTIPSLQPGGMERVMSELACYFASKSEPEVHLVLYGISREIFYPIPDKIIIHIPQFKFDNRWRLFCTFRTLYFLRNTIKKINPRSILSFGEYWNSFILISLYGLKFPVFVSDRCQPDKRLGKLHDWLRKKLYPKAAGIIVQTQKAGEIYNKQFNFQNIRVIGNPIRAINDKDNVVKENIVLMVGRLIKTKHQDKLIEIFTRISKPGWKLVIVGYDHLRQNNSEKLKRIIEYNNARNSVILEGKQADVETYYLKSRIFAFTSSSEGFPNVIGEAMSAGLPVIAFDCIAGPSEMIKDNQNGFLVPLFDYIKFQNKLEELMDNEKLRISFGKMARIDIMRFSIDSIGEKYFQLLLS